jgi:acetoacetate decarboxylase
MPYKMEFKELRRLIAAMPYLAEFVGAEMLMVRFRTDPDVVASVLPRPLKAPAEPLGMAFVARYPETNFGLRYNEGALFLDAMYKGERGSYCLAMPVDDDMAMVAGRETYGYPKKIADRITLERSGEHIVGSVVRKETEILRIECDLTRAWVASKSSSMRNAEDLEGRPCLVGTSWLFKHFPAAGNGMFETAPRLIREPVVFRPRPGQRSGDLDLKLVSSTTDPLGDIPIREVVEAQYGLFDNTMLPGRTVRRIRNLPNFIPRSLFTNDTFALVLESSPPARSLLEQVRLRRQLRRY